MKEINVAKIKVGGVTITLTQFTNGLMILEKNEGEKWFVSTQDNDGKFYLQENYDDGEIREMGVTDNLPDALYKLAWAQ